MSDYHPKIYVACLASYNAGKLYGHWISALKSVEEIEGEISSLLEKSPMIGAEEWEVHDYEDFGPFQEDTVKYLGSLEAITESARFLCEKHGELGATLVVEGHCLDIEKAEELLDQHYYGAYDDELDFAQDFFQEHYEDKTPEQVMRYIDYEKFKKDLFMDFFSIEYDGKTHVFDSNT